MPVEAVGVVDAEPQPELAAGRGKFRQRIPPERGRIDDVETGNPRVVHRKPVVVFRREHHVADSGVTEAADDLLRIERRRIELLRQRGIFGIGNPETRLKPLADILHRLPLPDPPGKGVEPPVNEGAEARFGKPSLLFHRLQLRDTATLAPAGKRG